MRESDFNYTVLSLPQGVILDTSLPVSKIASFFGKGPGLEYIVSRLVCALGDKTIVFPMVSQTVMKLRREFEANDLFKGDMNFYLTSMITLEQAALDIFDIFNQSGVYCNQRYLLFAYEGMIDDGSIALKLFESYADFCDEYAISMQEGIFDFEDNL